MYGWKCKPHVFACRVVTRNEREGYVNNNILISKLLQFWYLEVSVSKSKLPATIQAGHRRSIETQPFGKLLGVSRMIALAR